MSFREQPTALRATRVDSSTVAEPGPGRTPRWSRPGWPILAWILGIAVVTTAGSLHGGGSLVGEIDVDDANPRWFVCTIGGLPCGRMVESTSTTPAGVRTIETELVLRFLRQGVETETRVTSRMRTDVDGALMSMEIVQRLGERPLVARWSFREHDVEETRSQGGRTETRTHPPPASPWFTPDAAISRVMAVDGDEPTTLRVVDPANGIEPVPVTYRRLGTCFVEVDGRRLEGIRFELRQPDAPVVVETVDARGSMLSSRTSLGAGLGDLEIVRSSRRAAMAGGRAGVDLLDAGRVRPTFERTVLRPDRAASLTLRISPRAGTVPSFVDSGAQRVRREDATLVVTVTPGRTSPCLRTEAADLAVTPIADHEDPAVRRFAERASRGAGSTAETAERLRRAVHRHIDRKGLSTAFASASETVRDRRGDCTEHAVLLAATLRAVGIGSRVVNGLVWIPDADDPGGAYLWHMWTQAVIDGRWTDLDATLPPDGPGFHAGHLAVNTGDLSPASFNATGTAMMEVFGAIDIEILDRDPSP